MTTLDQYRSDGGIIITPGKFIGEPTWVPHFNARSSDHIFFGADNTAYAAYAVSAEDRALFPVLMGIFAVVLYDPDDCSITGMPFSTDYDLGVFIAERAMEGGRNQGENP